MKESPGTAKESEERRPIVPEQSEGRPFWALSSATNGSGASIEIVVPQGTVAKAHGKEVLLYNASSAENISPRALEKGAGTTWPPAAVAEGLAVSATPVGKMRLPVGVSPQDCSYDASRKAKGAQVLKCKLDDGKVKRIPITVSDEL